MITHHVFINLVKQLVITSVTIKNVCFSKKNVEKKQRFLWFFFHIDEIYEDEWI